MSAEVLPRTEDPFPPRPREAVSFRKPSLRRFLGKAKHLTHTSPIQGMNEQFNMFVEANTSSNDPYRKRCRENGVAAHPAMFPKSLPEFFIRFLTEPDDLVVDPFAGSNTTGKVADELGRRWVAIDQNRAYLETSRYRWSEFAAQE